MTLVDGVFFAHLEHPHFVFRSQGHPIWHELSVSHYICSSLSGLKRPSIQLTIISVLRLIEAQRATIRPRLELNDRYPPPVWVSLYSHFPFAFLDLFVSLLPFNKPSLLFPFSPWSLISPVLTPLLPRCLSFGFSPCFYLPAPLLCLLTFIFPISLNLSLLLSVMSCHLSGSGRSADAENGRWLTFPSL